MSTEHTEPKPTPLPAVDTELRAVIQKVEAVFAHFTAKMELWREDQPSETDEGHEQCETELLTQLQTALAPFRAQADDWAAQAEAAELLAQRPAALQLTTAELQRAAALVPFIAAEFADAIFPETLGVQLKYALTAGDPPTLLAYRQALLQRLSALVAPGAAGSAPTAVAASTRAELLGWLRELEIKLVPDRDSHRATAQAYGRAAHRLRRVMQTRLHEVTGAATDHATALGP